jgi:3-methylcrotonyl-CoA carboxylase alpha subunit
MIAKVIAHGATRDAALGKLLAALEETQVAGCVTNAGFLAALCRHEGFAKGDVDTGLIDRDLDSLIGEPAPAAEAVSLAALAALGLTEPRSGGDPWDKLAGWRLWSASRQFALLEYAGERRDVEVHAIGPGRFAVHLEDGPKTFDLIDVGETSLVFDCDGIRRNAAVSVGRGELTVFFGGHAYTFGLPDSLAGDEEAGGAGDQVIAPMPGLVKVLQGAAGDEVSEGQPLVILEAMKMEHTLKAPRDGIIGEVLVEAGEQVQTARSFWCSRRTMMLPEASTYEELTARFSWQIPDRFNIGVAICDAWADKDPRREALVYAEEGQPAHSYLWRVETAFQSAGQPSGAGGRSAGRPDRRL